MDHAAADPATCPRCLARVRPADAWCTLCHHPLGSPSTRPEPAPPPVPEPAPEFVPEPGPASGPVLAPEPVPAPAPPIVPGPRVGGSGGLPPEVLALLATELRDDGPSAPAVPWRRPWVVSVVGGSAVLVLLMTAMSLAGHLL